MKLPTKILLGFCLLYGSIQLAGCTTKEAATLAAIPGRVIGTTLGMTAVIIDESVHTAGDVVDANPRYKNKPRRTNCCQTRPDSHQDNQSHYYKAEVLIKTRGPAVIESVQSIEGEAIKEFWQ